MQITIDSVLETLCNQWAYVVLYFASATLLSAVALNFQEQRQRGVQPLRAERDVVATLSMTLFFIVTFALGQRGVGAVPLPVGTSLACQLLGVALVLMGTGANLAGRRALGRFWSDRIEVQVGHRVVSDGPYRWMRHPLYGSLIVFGIGMALLMHNAMVLTAVVAVFAPAMVHRARREERLLLETLGAAYRDYQRQCPMLLPRLSGAAVTLVGITVLTVQLSAAGSGESSLLGLAALLALGCAPLMREPRDRRLYLGAAVLSALCAAAAARLAICRYVPALAVMAALGWRRGGRPGSD